MRTALARLTGLLLAGAALAGSRGALAHPVTVDGSAAEWSTRLPNANNLGIIARNAAGHGEYIWRDAPADTRTDLAMPETVADMLAFQVTGDPTGVGFLVRRASNVSLAPPPIQVQIAIDLDRVDGSGQEQLAEFADTLVASGARWERLVETLFGSGGGARVVDGSFNVVAAVQAQQGAAGIIEIFVPWSALGLAGPPSTPLRFTVATFRTKDTDVTIDIGGSLISNALDVITDFDNPATSLYPNTSVEVSDQVVDHWFDLHFKPSGEIYSPLLVQRFLPNATFGGSDEWYVVRNVTPDPLPLAGFKLGDEETPDGLEGMYLFPDDAVVAAGATYTVARLGASYQSYYDVAPDAEVPPGALAAVPDMVAYTPWTSGSVGSMLLTNIGDEMLVLDPSNTLVDVAVYGAGTYTGIQAFTPAPNLDFVLDRNAAGNDTDNCQVDFSNVGKTCTADAQCGGVCFACVSGVCEPKPQGTACLDADPCNGDEICDGLGACVTGPNPPCDDGNACTTDDCAVGAGCSHTTLPAGSSCGDGSVCNGDEICDAAGVCLPGTPLECDDGNTCTLDACDDVAGCESAPAPAGSDCSDANACDGAEACDGAGVCMAAAPLDCDDGDPCTTDACDMAAGCQHSAAPDGVACADGDACNGDEVCSGGACAAGKPLDCDDLNVCTDDACDAASGCVHTGSPAGSACDDGDRCTEGDACDGDGTCAPGADNCGGEGGGGAGGSGAAGGAGGAGGKGGTGGSTSSNPTTGSGATSGGGEGGAGGAPDDGSCGCRLAGSDDRTSEVAWLAVIAAVAASRRRKPRASK